MFKKRIFIFEIFKEAADAISEEYARLRSIADVTDGSAKVRQES